MEAVKFEYANANLSKPASMTDEECSSLWVYTDGRECVSCWKLSWKQRFSALLFGTVWLGVLSGRSQPPVWLDCTKTIFINSDYVKNRKKIMEYKLKTNNAFLRWLVSVMEWVNENIVKEE